MDELIARAIDIDDRLFERAMEKRHDTGQGRAGFYHRPQKPSFNNRVTNDPYGHTPMELDAIHHKGKTYARKDKAFGKPKKALTCYACGKPGHMARNCKSKGKVHRQQLNALDGDWNVIEPEDGSPRGSNLLDEDLAN